MGLERLSLILTPAAQFGLALLQRGSPALDATTNFKCPSTGSRVITGYQGTHGETGACEAK